jgi:Flp pilus assembly protein TadG
MNDFGILRGERVKKASHPKGQSLVEFALLLPILALIIFGVLELGRAFFAFIAITNAPVKGAVFIQTGQPPGEYNTVNFEFGSPLVEGQLAPIQVQCGG